ncbi:MAG TPA: hypothetical protein DCZ11_03295 [Gammaproteobacteria bacterium]|nr:hypothetical protein [Gammaproteobacteria bacterium]MCH77452.1 hypothetical protein [Gammaproteobacteria bacterium]
MSVEYTKAELDEFRDLVEACESLHQMERIRGRAAMPAFVERVGKDKCDAMFQVLLREIGRTTKEQP